MASHPVINQFNTAIQTNGVKDAWLRSQGIDPSRPVRLSGPQREAFQRHLESLGAIFPDGVEIDPAGNMNENEGFTTQLRRWGPLAAAAALTLFGIPGTPIAGLLSGPGAAAAGGGAAAATGGGAAAAGGGAAAATGTGLGTTLLRYGLQYALPVVGSLIGQRMAANAEREGNEAMAGYYDRALDAEREEQQYRRGFDEEGRRYDRYKDTYGTLSDEEKLRYGRARDDYGRLSDEEKLAYDRAQGIRDKNYGYQQYGNFVETLEPFRASGAAATSRMSGLLGGPTPADTGSYLNLARTARESVQPVNAVPQRPTWNYTPNRPTWNYGGEDTAASSVPVNTTMPVRDGVAPPQVIRLQAPDGVVAMVPANQAEHYLSRGARRV